MEAIIVGAGAIGIGFNEDFIAPYFSSHFEEYKKKGIQVTWIVDQDKNLANKIAQRLSVPNATSKLADVDINSNEIFVSICTPTNTHFDLLRQALRKFPNTKLKIWLEKPASNNENELKEMEELLNRKSCEVLVNYPRRYDKNFEFVYSEIQSNKIQKILLKYSKGSFHNLPHFINILHWYCGRLSSIEFSKSIVRKPFVDVDGVYFFGNTEVSISSLNFKLFDHYELDIILDKKMFRFQDGGLELEEFTALNRFSRASKFLQKTKIHSSDSHNSMGFALDALIKGGGSILTPISNDYEIFEDINKILNWSKDVKI